MMLSSFQMSLVVSFALDSLPVHLYTIIFLFAFRGFRYRASHATRRPAIRRLLSQIKKYRNPTSCVCVFTLTDHNFITI